jgi:hypothetical protein
MIEAFAITIRLLRLDHDIMRFYTIERVVLQILYGSHIVRRRRSTEVGSRAT